MLPYLKSIFNSGLWPGVTTYIAIRSVRPRVQPRPHMRPAYAPTFSNIELRVLGWTMLNLAPLPGVYLRRSQAKSSLPIATRGNQEPSSVCSPPQQGVIADRAEWQSVVNISVRSNVAFTAGQYVACVINESRPGNQNDLMSFPPNTASRITFVVP